MEIRVDNLEYSYNAGTPLEIRALEGISFKLTTGWFMGILGGTGAGKTTLIKHLNGLLMPAKGQVLVDGKETRLWGSELRRRVGIVFQRPERQLFEDTVYKDISFVLRRFSGLGDEEIKCRVHKACKQVGLAIEEIADRSPLALSDGQRRKVALAAVLVNEPDTVILDEPAVGLDPRSRWELIQALKAMKKSGDKTVVIVSHDMEPFLPVLDHLMVLQRGRVAGQGAPAEVCGRLADDPKMRELLPGTALIANDLRKAGVMIPENEFSLTVLADKIAAIPGFGGRGH